MGTSKSGSGPGSGVPLVPPWVPDLPSSPAEPDPQPGDDGRLRPAPAGRFGPARRSLGSFARQGATPDMRRGLGHYVRRGYGGSRTATQRMGGTVRAAGALYDALSSSRAADEAEPGSGWDLSDLDGRSADEIMDAVAEAVRPTDGTLDAEAGREAVRDALSELLGRFPDADLLSLSEDQRVFAVERYIAFDVYNLFRLDVGKTIHDKALNATEALSRLREVKDYLVESVSSRFRALRGAREQLTGRRVAELATRALQETFEVFEAYVT